MTGKELKEILNNLTEEQLKARMICEIEFTGYWGEVEYKMAEENMYYDSEYSDSLVGESELLENEKDLAYFELQIMKGDPYLVIL